MADRVLPSFRASVLPSTAAPQHRSTETRLAISNGRLGMILLIGTETILFSCFIGAYLVLRMGATIWPPIGSPALSLGLSSVNTSVLVLSTILVFRRQIRATFALGSLFLLLQAVEFHRLYARGLTLQTGAYGALFYSLISCHGLHVLGGLAILGMVLWRMGSDPSLSEWIGHAQLYWHFVTGVWLVLFTILYLV